MISLPFLLAALLACNVLCGRAAAGTQALLSTALGAAHLSAGDLDGDGRAEIVVAGRPGPFVPPTGPPAPGRLLVCAAEKGRLQPQAAAALAAAPVGVAAADIDGDGRAEIVVGGALGLRLLRLENGRLQPQAAAMPSLAGTPLHLGAADIDGDGRAEAVLAAGLPGRGEVRPSALYLLRFPGWQTAGALRVEGHIGALCLGDIDGDGRAELVLEEGGEEMGGLLRVFAFASGDWQLRFEQQLTADYRRLLALSCGPGLLSAGTADGEVLLLRPQGNRFAQVRRTFVPRGAGRLGALHSTALSGSTPALLAATGGGALWLLAEW